jgi:hypothetical protein
MQREHFFGNKEEENKKNCRERSKDYIQLNSHSSKVSYVHKRIKKHWRQKISESHNSSYFYEGTVPLVPFNCSKHYTVHPKKEQSHEINLALLTYMVGTLLSLGQQGSRDFVSHLIWSPNG